MGCDVLYSVFIADNDRENMQALVRLLQKDQGISPKIWRNRWGLRSFLSGVKEGAVFIRIDDPAFPGLKLTNTALEFYPNIQLVWMAGDDSHALTAFSLGVDAYLLLPATAESLDKVMKSLELKKTVRTDT